MLSNWKHEGLHNVLASDTTETCVGKLYKEASRGSSKTTWWITSSQEFQLQHTAACDEHAAAYEILQGFTRTLESKEPDRLACLVRSLDARIRAAGAFADESMVALRQDLGQSPAASAFAVVNEGKDIPEGGIEFDIPPEHHKNITKSLLSSVRRLHINTGHPPNAELERIVRLAGGSEQARIAVKGLKCSICRKALPAKSPRPGKPRQDIGQFNETVLANL